MTQSKKLDLEEKVAAYFDELDTLPKAEKAILKRNAGNLLREFALPAYSTNTAGCVEVRIYGLRSLLLYLTGPPDNEDVNGAQTTLWTLRRVFQGPRPETRM